ncbi:hypothetical protein K2173_013392 [Erythroxylum novogranatense]|uniref:Uncharacterized protein n=1 Tax=Erythroxylum novogranatense TaxID=1862640 RepID=A0AAV8SA54_9ROSI|nr:hypothetical protein K2173_013392 [Erythroxylum novogranatense]
MAYGGVGFAISYPLAQAVAKMQARCIKRYPATKLLEGVKKERSLWGRSLKLPPSSEAPSDFQCQLNYTLESH